MDEKPLAKSSADIKEQPQNGLPLNHKAPQTEHKSVWRYKRLWGVILLFLFIGGVGGFVPVSKIPLFSRLVQAMGFSAEEAGKMSLLKALLKWHQKYQAGKADALSEEEIAANVRASAERNLALSAYEIEQNKQNASSLLISMRTLNSEQRRMGEAVDVIKGVAPEERGSEKERAAVEVKNIDDSVANTEANTAQKGEVSFGDNASSLQRDEQHGFNSTKMLSKIENPHIAGATSSSWLTDTIDKAMRADANLGQLPKELDAMGHAVSFEDLKKIGNDRPHRDMYYAWLTGKASFRTPNRMLKKTLAAAGFNGEEMPKKVFDSSLLGVGLGIDPNDVNQDAKSIKERMAKEEDCKAKLFTGSSTKIDAYNNIKAQIDSLGSYFPSNCEEVYKNEFDRELQRGFNAALNRIKKECESINAYYASLEKECSVAYTAGTCPSLSGNYEANFEAFKKMCDAEFEECKKGTKTDKEGNEVPKTDEDCKAERPTQLGPALCGDTCDGDKIENKVRVDITGYTDGENGEEYKDSTSVNEDEKGQRVAGIKDFMPSQSSDNIAAMLGGLLK